MKIDFNKKLSNHDIKKIMSWSKSKIKMYEKEIHKHYKNVIKKENNEIRKTRSQNTNSNNMDSSKYRSKRGYKKIKIHKNIKR